MKVLGIICSPRKGGNTEILMQEAMAGAQESGAETELVTVRNKEIKPCDGCLSCVETGKCHLQDDMQAIYPKILSADGIIWGTPVYFFSVTAQTKIILDRLYVFYTNRKLVNKVGGVISVASDKGHLGVWDLFNAFFWVNRMFGVDIVHAYARLRGDVRKDRHAMKAAGELGRLVALVSARQWKYPEEYHEPLFRLVKRKYDIDMCPAMNRFER